MKTRGFPTGGIEDFHVSLGDSCDVDESPSFID